MFIIFASVKHIFLLFINQIMYFEADEYFVIEKIDHFETFD